MGWIVRGIALSALEEILVPIRILNAASDVEENQSHCGVWLCSEIDKKLSLIVDVPFLAECSYTPYLLYHHVQSRYWGNSYQSKTRFEDGTRGSIRGNLEFNLRLHKLRKSRWFQKFHILGNTISHPPD
jgi:hypothetical protein